MNNYDDLIQQLAAEETTADVNTSTEIVDQNTAQTAIDNSASQENVNNQPPADVNTPVSTERTNQEPEAQSTQTTTPEPVAQPDNVTTPAPAQEPVNVFDWNRVSEMSGSFIRDESSFKQSLEKAQKFDDLEKEVLSLRDQKPANEFVDNFNKLIKSGATSEQLNAFMHVNTIDIDALTPEEALIQKAILVDGKPRALAAFDFRSQFNLKDYDEDSEDYQAMQEKIKYEGAKAANELEKYKSNLSTYTNEEAAKVEAARLEEISKKENYTNLIKAQAPILASKFDGKLVLNDGEKDHELVMDDAFKANIPALIENFFINNNLPIDSDSLQQSAKHIEDVYFLANRDKIIKDIRNKVASEMEEKLANKYENRGGLTPNAQVNVQTTPTVSSEDIVADLYNLR